jgi:hypothetical protein
MAIDGRLEPYREISFPNLFATGYRVTSPTAAAYNCFAWAAGEDDRWWNLWSRRVPIIGSMVCLLS